MVSIADCPGSAPNFRKERIIFSFFFFFPFLLLKESQMFRILFSMLVLL